MPGTIDTVDLFAGLFKGRAEAWRGTTGAIHKEQVTKEHYKKHLDGAQSLAIFPLLDDGTCWWAALDLDIKDWAKAVALHDELLKHNCPAYISASKSKGYHIWVFADQKEPFVAKDIRRLFYNIVKQLGIKEAEIFPKQDALDSTVPIGNCLNLPGFASFSKDPKNPPVRQFLDKDQKMIPLQQFVTSALHTTRKTIADALAKFGSVIPTIVPSKTKFRVKGKDTSLYRRNPAWYDGRVP